MTVAMAYFAKNGGMTSPGAYTRLLKNLPTDLAELCKVVQGTTLHIFWAGRYGIELSEERQGEVQLRSMERRLQRMEELDPRPLTETRPLEKKIVGNCRDFSVMLVSLLRWQGLPARARCGFGTYFLPGHYEDHWVCEYWNAAQKRWVFADAQLDAFQCAQLKIAFDPLDVPRDQFLTGGKAWQMCRSGQADPDAFGIFDMHGLGFVRGNFVRDVAALNKVELLPWDCWGIMEAPDQALTPEDLMFLDDLAALTCGEVPDFDRVRKIYQSDPRVRIDTVIHSYVQSGRNTIEVAPNQQE